MNDVSVKPIHFFFDFNAVVVNLDSIPKEEQIIYIEKMEKNIKVMKEHLSKNIKEKENHANVPQNGLFVLQQQMILADAIENWLNTIK